MTITLNNGQKPRRITWFALQHGLFRESDQKVSYALCDSSSNTDAAVGFLRAFLALIAALMTASEAIDTTSHQGTRQVQQVNRYLSVMRACVPSRSKRSECMLVH